VRPSPYEIIDGVVYTHTNVFLPIVMMSGDAEAFREASVCGSLMKRLSASWDTEGENLCKENKELREGLQAAVPALKEAGLDALAGDTESQLAKEYYPKEAYAPVRALMQENHDLKAVLDRFLVAVAGVQAPPQALQDVKASMRKIMKRQVERDLGLQMMMLGYVMEQSAALAKAAQQH